MIQVNSCSPLPPPPTTTTTNITTTTTTTTTTATTATTTTTTTNTNITNSKIIFQDSGARITINGRRVKLAGYNRHTLWPDTGAAVSPTQEAADIALLQELNVVYVRGAHYPQSQSFLDRLDELGMVLWEETLGPGVSTKDVLKTDFMKAQLEKIDAMVGASFAHPSVIIHGFFNEGPSDNKSACAAYGAMADRIRSRVVTPNAPPMRFVSWANNHGSKDACIVHEDVISFNSYPGTHFYKN